MKKIIATWQVRDANNVMLDQEDWYLRIVYSNHEVYKEGDMLTFTKMKSASVRGYEIIIMP